MGISHTFTKVTMMATKMNVVNPPSHGLLMDTQDQNNGKCGLRPSENSSQVIIAKPIFTNLENGQITVKTIGRGYIIGNHTVFSINVPLAQSEKV